MTDGDWTDEPETDDGAATADEPATLRPRGTQRDVVAATDDRLIVSAGAGTGKTQTMAWRIEDAIENRGVAPERVLVLTFANEAAHAIKDDLGDLLADGRGYDVDAYTYHAFCQQLLGEYAYYFDLAPEFDLVTDDDRRAIVQSLVDDLEYRFVEPIDARTGADRVERDLIEFIEDLKRAGVTPDEVASSLPETGTIARLSTLARELHALGRRLFDTDRNPTLTDDPLAFQDRFQKYRTVLRHKRGQLESGTPVEAEVADYLGTMLDLVDELEALLLNGASSWYERFVPQALLAGNVPTFFSDTYQTPIGRLVAFVEMLQQTHDFLPGYRAYERELAGEGAFQQALDYDDLIRWATTLLSDETVRSGIVDQWDLILCDEFQDTDDAQLELIAALGAETELFVIGDQDQAIYEWRGAHPENMDRISDELEGFERYSLDLNFRSPDAILDLVADLPADSQGLSAFKDDVENAVVTVDAADEEEEQAAQVSTAISKLVKGTLPAIEAADLGDVAVLVRTKRQADLVAAQLDEACLPYELAHDMGGETSPGIETVLAYLRVLVDPHDDVSLNRVLTMFYRVPAADLDRLNRAETSTYRALSDRPANEFDAPERLERARSDVETLRSKRHRLSISELYAELKRETRFEWFLTAGERRELAAIERLMESFDEGRVTQSRLTEEFVSYLELQGEISGRESGGDLETAAGSDDKIDVMTIFQAKGLEFDVVMLPFLSADHWPPLPPGTFPNPYPRSTHSFSALADLVDADRATSLWTDHSVGEVPEEWRVLHVGLTRAKERLFLFGTDPDEPDVPASQLDEYLAGVEWSVGGPHMDVWDRITDSYEQLDDRFRTDLTDEIDAGLDRESVSLQYFETPIALEDAIDETLELARQLRAGTLSTIDPETVGYRTDLTGGVGRELERRHSHSSVETVGQCERRHVLDHVVDAFADPLAYGLPDSSDATGASPIAIGTLFHFVAEEAFWRDYTGPDEWRAACDRLGRLHGLEDAVPAARACVDRYFATPASDWETLGAEVPFELADYDASVGGPIVGSIDAIARTDDGEVVILDYKTGSQRKELGESYQLLLYLLAARDVFSTPIRTAGYVYVGPNGPDVQLFSAAQLLDMRPQLTADLRAADESEFGTAQCGLHCRDCTHTSLGCADDGIVE
ncbi:ATP-dependent helicase [Halosolutus amylolyticus]|uniref:DNA 3'-5' helicase n=1 Tax=Halosolutus amylolyticus TaxID=2932267 RepID=A0ABD5PV22_9EURY|nr:ATP-dependent DNA helicase [Halosolutus amylolyticus]